MKKHQPVLNRSCPMFVLALLLWSLAGSATSAAMAQPDLQDETQKVREDEAAESTSDGTPGPAGPPQAGSEPPSIGEAKEPAIGLDERLGAAKVELERLISTPGTEESRLRYQRNLVEILDASLKAEQKIAGFARDIAEADNEGKMAEARLVAAENARVAPVDPSLALAGSRKRLLELDGRVADLARELANVEEAIDRRESRRVGVRGESANLKSALAILDGASDDTVEQRQPKRERIRSEAKALELEIRSYDATDESLRTLQKSIAIELRVAREEQEAWGSQVDGLEVDDFQRKLETATKVAAGETDPLLKSVAEANLVLAKRLVRATDSDIDRSSRLQVQKRLLDRLRRGTESDQRRFTDRVTPAIATVLRKRDTALPDSASLREEIAKLKRLIPEVELERLLLEDKLASIRSVSRTAADMLDSATPPMSEEARTLVESRLVTLLEDQLEVYGRPLLKAIGLRMEELSGLLETNLAVVFEIERYRSFVLEQTVWVRDAAALEPGFWSRVSAQAGKFFDPTQWRLLGGVMLEEIGARPIFAALAFGPGLFVILLRRRIVRRITVAGDRVARAETDRFRETLFVVALNLLFGFAVAAPFWFLSVAVERDFGRSVVLDALGNILPVAAVFTFVLATLTAVVRKGGLAERHFRWSEHSVLIARRLVFFTWISIIFGISNRMCDPRELDLPDLGRLFFSPIPIVVATFLISLVRSGWDRTLVKNAGGRIPLEKFRGEKVLILGAACIPVISLVFANIGWYEAVSLIQRAVVASILFLLVLLIVRETLNRGLHARMRKESWLLRRQREEGTDTAGEVEELEEIGERTTSAIRFCMVTLLLLGLWVLWAGLLPAFQILQGMELWSYRVDAGLIEGDGMSVEQVLVAVTVGDLLIAIGIIAAASYAARNLPTVVELLLLDRVGLERGVKYAVGQLIQWVLIIAGVTAACAMVGVTWASVQWLAAGFTVGLGFGLQEIFANFISGLIILFEQPVRVGDVVTVGQTTGQISRIRMRSTTITDWDRKELIVPNKQFITTEVVNWSIGESCIRLVLPVGVSYGDDPEKVLALLLKLGIEDPGTLVNPEPTVSFTGFGDSSLDFQLRVYLPGTDSLMPVRNRLNMAIKKSFDENGINIPFPQRDVQVSMVDRDDPEGGRSAPLPIPSDPSGADAPEGERS